jgi:hypothetical protein
MQHWQLIHSTILNCFLSFHILDLSLSQAILEILLRAEAQLPADRVASLRKHIHQINRFVSSID